MRRGDSRVLLIGAALMIATGLLDYLTPAEVDFTPFYMLPVVLTAWVLGWKAGLAFGMVGAATEFIADDVMRGLVLATALWNGLDRKSTRLNSSHSSISYAVFCLKKKNKKKEALLVSAVSSPIYAVPSPC